MDNFSISQWALKSRLAGILVGAWLTDVFEGESLFVLICESLVVYHNMTLMFTKCLNVAMLAAFFSHIKCIYTQNRGEVFGDSSRCQNWWKEE